jgi:hypothetical protein
VGFTKIGVLPNFCCDHEIARQYFFIDVMAKRLGIATTPDLRDGCGKLKFKPKIYEF